VQNIYKDYYKLNIKTNETFLDFYTRFLHLASERHILDKDLRLDLYNKITLELQYTIALTKETLTTLLKL
jgi:hypothetical protein